MTTITASVLAFVLLLAAIIISTSLMQVAVALEKIADRLWDLLMDRKIKAKPKGGLS